MTPQYKVPESTEIVRYIFKNKFTVLGVPFAVSVIVAIITLFIPNKYTSTANLFPSQRPSLGLDLFSEQGGLSTIASSVLGGNSDETNKYIVLLSSYSTSKKVIDKFNLVEVYEVSDADDPDGDAIEILLERSTFEGLEEGNFVISVLDESPTRAKNMANYYVQLLNELNTKIVSNDARLYREFLELRYNQLVLELDSLQSEYIDLQKKYGVFELPEQVKGYFNLMGLLTAQQLEAEVKLNVLSETVSKSSELYKNQLVQYEAISNKLNELYNDENPKNIVLNFNSLAEVGSQYFSLVYQLEIQIEIQKFLLPLYEQAKMEEAKSFPIVSVIDEPREAIEKTSPKRFIIVILTGISSFIFTLSFLVFKYNFTINREFIESLNR